ncbi:hypothetical protein C8J57DRAFT_1194628 [Mycena rebaudengoi]|nr:hypothetical protein C8J57DRAFT_1194628 [Mycena rebaudengoi]
MALLISHISVGAAATIINILVASIQYTLALALPALLVYSLPPINSAVAWNVIARRLHGSLWPTFLRTGTLRGTGFQVMFFSYISLLSTILIIVAGVVMPLGLSAGPPRQAALRSIPATFVTDTSPMGLATSPRIVYKYSRTCGGGTGGTVACPGNAENTTAAIAPAIIDRFNATPYGPFGMQFRRYYEGHSGDMTLPQISMTESIILRKGIFAVGGLIVDLEKPGIGLWNHTFPTRTPNGGVWEEDVLWIEPVSTCIDANLTVDYELHDLADVNAALKYNLTDRGGFSGLTHEYPELNRNGQPLDLWQHAWTGVVLNNFFSMQALNNLTRNETYPGRAFALNSSQGGYKLKGGKMQTMRLPLLDNPSKSNDGVDPETLCRGFRSTANITNVSVYCRIFLAQPRRTDGGDPLIPADNSTWSQRVYGCASATRARMQRVQFSFNGTMDLSALSITRRDIDTPVLWATEKMDINIMDIDLFWGRVPDSLEGDASLSTIRSDVFYLPAGGVDISGLLTIASGYVKTPLVMPALAWATALEALSSAGIQGFPDYSGTNSFALQQKYQSLMLADSANGAAKIQNLVWTDVMANNMLGSDTRQTLLVVENVPTTAYDLRYAIPALLLLLLWVPSLAGALFVLVMPGMLNVSYLRYLIGHTAAGRIAVGDSTLRSMNPASPGYALPQATTPPDLVDESQWAKGAGCTPMCVDSGGAGME